MDNWKSGVGRGSNRTFTEVADSYLSSVELGYRQPGPALQLANLLSYAAWRLHNFENYRNSNCARSSCVANCASSAGDYGKHGSSSAACADYADYAASGEASGD